MGKMAQNMRALSDKKWAVRAVGGVRQRKRRKSAEICENTPCPEKENMIL
ncbi:hypothetical protein BACCAP_00132 [Pseudoflavonifractor capillosus ATCC 29799]|uniref:Uncharacterized protein n=1 Tax=Pseudoflavonifractor capillosus ATCC 29799 TaxID=411467 RepID=A6NPL6_9FIRM|nr:hypothetical protein BACCAP_00132 [Pseudoflavonifractor capillosus ATCC 29799]